MTQAISIEQFAKIIARILKTDRWTFIVCDGEMGEGKSCITSQLAGEIAKETKTPFNYNDNMTYTRKELKTWIDGDENGQHQKPEYSSILADEIISMFFKRNWYDAEQIDGVELLNKCRDRHLCVIGNIPNFWDLDSTIYPITTFWIHVHERGRAWVYKKDRNPFAKDKWHIKVNEKAFAKGGAYGVRGLVCEIIFPDWPEKEKAEYYAVRNTKRIRTEGQRQTEKIDRHRKLKYQRDQLIKHILIVDPNTTYTQLAKLTGLSNVHIRDLATEDKGQS